MVTKNGNLGDTVLSASKDYTENLIKFHTIDGVKAIILYGIYILILFIQGLTYTTNLSVDILNKQTLSLVCFGGSHWPFV